MKCFASPPRSAFPVVVLSLVAGVVACDRGKTVDLESSSPSAHSESPSPKSESDGERRRRDGRFETAVVPDRVEVGETTDVRLEIRAGEGLKMNREFPSWSLAFDSADGMALAPTSFDAEDLKLEKGRAYASAELTPETPGRRSLTAEATFSVCNPEKCHILRDESIAFDVRVDDSSSGDGAAE